MAPLPRPDDYFADPEGEANRALAGDQFAGVREFPYRSWDLNRLPVHPDLVDMAERYLETPELHLYKVELWGKYAGAVNYDQPLHRDYGSHSLVVPRPRRATSRSRRSSTSPTSPRSTRPPSSSPTTTARTFPSPRCSSPSGSWPTGRCRASDRRAHCSSTGPTSCTAARTSAHRIARASRSWSTSRCAAPPGAARWPGPRQRRIGGPSSSPVHGPPARPVRLAAARRPVLERGDARGGGGALPGHRPRAVPRRCLRLPPADRRLRTSAGREPGRLIRGRRPATVRRVGPGVG